MKILVTLLFSLITCGIYFNPDSDVQGVEKALNFYLEGADADEVSKAFHPQAELKFVRDGAYQEVSIDEFLNRIRSSQRPERKTRIRFIQITGNAASACVETEYKTHSFVDFMNLLKIDGEWKIVNKIFERIAKDTAEG